MIEDENSLIERLRKHHIFVVVGSNSLGGTTDYDYRQDPLAAEAADRIEGLEAEIALLESIRANLEDSVRVLTDIAQSGSSEASTMPLSHVPGPHSANTAAMLAQTGSISIGV